MPNPIDKSLSDVPHLESLNTQQCGSPCEDKERGMFFRKQSLYILSTTRAKAEFYLHYSRVANIDFTPLSVSNTQELLINDEWFSLFDFSRKPDMQDGILPSAMTLGEFFQRVVYSSRAFIPKNIQGFFLSQALKSVKKAKKLSSHQCMGFLCPEESFIAYLESSTLLLQFYDELREHKIPITAEKLRQFSSIDTYDEYEWQLALLAEIYAQYQDILALNNLTDSIYSNDIAPNYQVLQSYLEEFESIHIELEGFISPLQHEVLLQVAKIIPVFVHFHTDEYNVSHYIASFGVTLESKKKYIYCLSNAKMICSNDRKLQLSSLILYKTQKVMNQANLALYLASVWQRQILQGEAIERDFAIIVPNESFINYLMVLDSYTLFNYAMGIPIHSINEYRILQSIYELLQQDTYKGLPLEPLFNFLIAQRDSIQSCSDTNEQTRLLQQALQRLFPSVLKDYRLLESTHTENPCQDSHSFSEFLLVLIENPSCHYVQEPTLQNLEDVLFLLFSQNKSLLAESVRILSSLHALYNADFFAVQPLDFYQLFTLFMRDLSRLNLSDVAGGKIRVMGALEARSLSFKEVLIVDFTDDYIPNVQSQNMFLNSKIRRFYNIPTKLDKENLFKHHYYSIMKNTQKTYISFVSNAQKVPSTFLFELHCDIDSAHDIDMMYSYYDVTRSLNHVFQEDSFPPFAYTQPFSATALDTYQKCIRKFYFYYIENLRNEPLIQEDINRKDIGLCIHGALQVSYAPFINVSIGEKEIESIAKIFQQECAMRIARENYTLATRLEIERLCFIMRHFFEYQKQRARADSLQILALEHTFHVSCCGYEFRGTIDRVEKYGDAIWIYDYKTGTKPKQIESLQMPLYSLCLEKAKESFDFLTPYRDLPIYYAYFYLEDFALNNAQSAVVLQDTLLQEQRLQTLFNMLESFGKENLQTQQKRNCEDCEYTLLCQRT
ncbi:PD-(D/E)XK nuclease family protein [Helicobacter aurati]|uniref:PD-(D/E)XK nuclease family protein n=1 Tax=Helicobacter aurati TaxID=137778 RepID=A0A3D8J628_9HELI|nr:PD-(D/E)XK nuclease family protein [Helicobacter aurati]RDU72933.1 PD-(D/E)XK nuclease family protein [Helicobacter aurati]